MLFSRLDRNLKSIEALKSFLKWFKFEFYADVLGCCVKKVLFFLFEKIVPITETILLGKNKSIFYTTIQTEHNSEYIQKLDYESPKHSSQHTLESCPSLRFFILFN